MMHLRLSISNERRGTPYFAGQPAISLPNGFSSAGLPLGLQIVGRPNDEAGVLMLAAAFEETRPWREQH